MNRRHYADKERSLSVKGMTRRVFFSICYDASILGKGSHHFSPPGSLFALTSTMPGLPLLLLFCNFFHFCDGQYLPRPPVPQCSPSQVAPSVRCRRRLQGLECQVPGKTTLESLRSLQHAIPVIWQGIRFSNVIIPLWPMHPHPEEFIAAYLCSV